jgi:hypothetical protein
VFGWAVAVEKAVVSCGYGKKFFGETTMAF